MKKLIFHSDQIKEKTQVAAYNLLGFFNLLLKIDRRINPQNYTKKNRK